VIYGYARVSTDGQSVAAQVELLGKAGAGRVFREVATTLIQWAGLMRAVLEDTLESKVPPLLSSDTFRCEFLQQRLGVLRSAVSKPSVNQL
jgi:hypothetical protein